MPTLPLAQHVFDYLLARPPIACVYLAAAVSNILILAHVVYAFLYEPGLTL